MGGKFKNKHRSQKRPNAKGTIDKIPVIGAISRKGNVVCQMIENADKPTLDRFVRKVVSDICPPPPFLHPALGIWYPIK